MNAGDTTNVLHLMVVKTGESFVDPTYVDNPQPFFIYRDEPGVVTTSADGSGQTVNVMGL